MEEALVEAMEAVALVGATEGAALEGAASVGAVSVGAASVEAALEALGVDLEETVAFSPEMKK